MPRHQSEVRYYIACRPEAQLRGFYSVSAEARIREYLEIALKLKLPEAEVRVAGLPTASTLEKAGAALEPRTDPSAWIIALAIHARDTLRALDGAVHDPSRTTDILGGGADLPVATAEHWCPREALEPMFGGRAMAHRRLGLGANGLNGLRGTGVNVVIVDQGVSRAAVEHQLGGRYGGGWDIRSQNAANRTHGTVASRHGMMVARNVLAVAPDATIFDLPLIPERITDLPTFLSTAEGSFREVMDAIRAYKAQGLHRGPWVIVNAWSVFDQRLDIDGQGQYADGGGHPFNVFLHEFISEGHDVVFCAGNCGQFCPDGRCGPTTVGPGQSIIGANSHPDVLTVGAVRSDGFWLGYSSQGPGQSTLCIRKPDLCAPSQFREDDDPAQTNSGTSAASALTAGVIAALRELPEVQSLAPGELFQVLRETATDAKPGSEWRYRLGSGILNAQAAYAAIQARRL